MRGRWLLPALLAMAARIPSAAAVEMLDPEPPRGGLFATVGLGVIDIEKGTGLDLPIGFTAISPRWHAMATLTAFDLALLQGDDRDPRYAQLTNVRTGLSACVDTQSGRVVPFSLCSGSTDALRSLAVDVNLLPVEMVYVGDKAGSLHAGIGLRVYRPRTVYGTIGMFFPTPSGRAGGVRLTMGRNFIFLGFSWGLDLRRVLDYF